MEGGNDRRSAFQMLLGTFLLFHVIQIIFEHTQANIAIVTQYSTHITTDMVLVNTCPFLNFPTFPTLSRANLQ
jgi:hypothetical protein